MPKMKLSKRIQPDDDDPIKLNGGFELSDYERARLELRLTQMKFNGSHQKPESNPKYTRKSDALEELHNTLRDGAPSIEVKLNSKKRKEDALVELHETLRGQNNIQMKQNKSSKKTLKQARSELKRTLSKVRR